MNGVQKAISCKIELLNNINCIKYNIQILKYTFHVDK